MLMKKLRSVAVLAGLVAATMASPAAHAMGLLDITLQGGLNDTVNNGGGVGYVAGGGINLWLGPVFTLEVDAEYVSRSFTGLTSNINWLEIPVLLRYSMMPMLSVGVGGYYDAAITSGAGSNDGLVGSLRLKLPAMPLFIDGRFNLGLKNDVVGNSMDDLQVMVGFMF